MFFFVLFAFFFLSFSFFRTTVKQLKKDLPLEFGSSIFVRVDKSRPHVMQCMITGPGETPYDSGCFQFDIYCPSTFPSGPPKVNLQTTGKKLIVFLIILIYF